MRICFTGGALKATGVASLDVATQGRCAAALHGLHHFEMRNRQRMVAAIRLAIGAKDIGQFNAASCCCRPLIGGQHGLDLYNGSLSRGLTAESTFCGRSLKYRWVDRSEV